MRDVGSEAMTATEPLTPAADGRTLPDYIVFYDGVCALCNEGIRQLMRLDTHGRLRYAPLQGETARALGIEWDAAAPDHEATFRFVDTTGDEPRISERMTAVADELAAIDRFPLVQAWIRLSPKPLMDLLYTGIAASRYRLFGKYDECRIPTPEERALFLD